LGLLVLVLGRALELDLGLVPLAVLVPRYCCWGGYDRHHQVLFISDYDQHHLCSQ